MGPGVFVYLQNGNQPGRWFGLVLQIIYLKRKISYIIYLKNILDQVFVYICKMQIRQAGGLTLWVCIQKVPTLLPASGAPNRHAIFQVFYINKIYPRKNCILQHSMFKIQNKRDHNSYSVIIFSIPAFNYSNLSVVLFILLVK